MSMWSARMGRVCGVGGGKLCGATETAEEAAWAAGGAMANDGVWSAEAAAVCAATAAAMAVSAAEGTAVGTSISV